MNTRSLLAVALATALFPPLVLAQSLTGETDDSGRPAIQAESELAEQDLPPQVNEAEADTDPRVPTVEDLEDPMRAPIPPQHAPPEPSPAPDPVDADRWQQLDTDGDGRISAEEGQVDADFGSNFEMMDVDHDGYVDEGERGEPQPAGDADDDRDEDDASGRRVDADDHRDGVHDVVVEETARPVQAADAAADETDAGDERGSGDSGGEGRDDGGNTDGTDG